MTRLEALEGVVEATRVLREAMLTSSPRYDERTVFIRAGGVDEALQLLDAPDTSYQPCSWCHGQGEVPV